jgi:hypothetical protein
MITKLGWVEEKAKEGVHYKEVYRQIKAKLENEFKL